ncbi:ABC transporter permease [Bryobacter aggregatus]|uniref:ABC transporter permease n=1 Tax=Bryobacter aggregatus TaxID=360054 RepID=UPI0004E1C703|nr:ABC transporter permease [Bryobacter aggregatus]
MIRRLRGFCHRFLGSLNGHGREIDLAEELESHIQMLADENMRSGLPPDEAHRRAKLQFGSVESAKETYREQRGLPVLDAIGQDLRYAFRWIRNNPGFAATAILSLAIGIGANTAIFSVVNTVILRPLAYKDPENVFAVREVVFNSPGQGSASPINPLHAREWAKRCPSLEQVALMHATTSNVVTGEDSVSIPGVDVPHNLFALFGIEPILGRAFLAEEELEGKNNVAILSESLWRSRFHADRSLIGKMIVVDGQNHEVVGIVPAPLWLPYHGRTNVRFEIFRPLVLAQPELSRIMGNFNYSAVVRVRRGGTPEQALAEINVVQARFPAQLGRKEGLTARLIPAHELFTGSARLGLWLLAASVGAVLFIVCVNLANLLLARNASRSRETAIRTALGASRGRQFRMVMTESLVLAVSGGALGILLARWSLRILVATTTLDIPRLDEIRVDSTVLFFALCLTLLAVVVFGALPAWRLTRADPQEALRAGGRSATEGRHGLRLREGLISIEVALSAALLIVAGLLTGSLTRLLQVDKGFDMERVLTVDVQPTSNLYANDGVREKLFERLLTKVRAISGVEVSGAITHLPTLGHTWNDPIYLEGTPREQQHPVDNRYSSPGYFSAMNIPIRAGRMFEESDRGRGVAVLSVKAAKLLWPAELNPVGRTFMGEDDKVKTLVGIVADVRAELQSDPPPTAYYPYWQRVPDGLSLVIRTRGDPRAIVGAIQAAIRSEDAQLPIKAIRTLEDVVDRSVAQRRFQLTLMAAFATCALLVACLGIYGVVSYSVIRRRSEIGIRMALGAQRSQVLWMIVGKGMAPVAVGLAVGISVALIVGRAIRGLLFAVEPTDPLTIAGGVVVLMIVAASACLIPANRAAGTDAITALRFE